jgi:hypothetical protein
MNICYFVDYWFHYANLVIYGGLRTYLYIAGFIMLVNKPLVEVLLQVPTQPGTHYTSHISHHATQNISQTDMQDGVSSFYHFTISLPKS